MPYRKDKSRFQLAGKIRKKRIDQKKETFTRGKTATRYAKAMSRMKKGESQLSKNIKSHNKRIALERMKKRKK